MTILVTSDDVATKLKEYFSDAQVEVFTDFPSDEAVISEGIYVARFYQEARRKSFNTMMGSNLYDVVDRLEMYLVSGQSNSNVDDYLNTLSGFIDDVLFEGYSPREYTVEQVYANSSERYRIIFNLTRQEITQ
jgi:hypothetical protein